MASKIDDKTNKEIKHSLLKSTLSSCFVWFSPSLLSVVVVVVVAVVVVVVAVVVAVVVVVVVAVVVVAVVVVVVVVAVSCYCGCCCCCCCCYCCFTAPRTAISHMNLKYPKNITP